MVVHDTERKPQRTSKKFAKIFPDNPDSIRTNYANLDYKLKLPINLLSQIIIKTYLIFVAKNNNSHHLNLASILQ